ncbi:hypothetical protein [Thermaerobacillus caldiproteolyticus]|uniref:hypothetical protein n=1 Tax=Thermaerobacillus caldiproteolyticus TaxID=247480 RepID=UPI00188CDB15|nr:hypothetical protein [Anoxybacillus caldiproteolyticus]QPA30500.1 hypothetical protein ISX45_12965 [Anoxybacillus caldiproteolyticus]
MNIQSLWRQNDAILAIKHYIDLPDGEYIKNEFFNTKESIWALFILFEKCETMEQRIEKLKSNLSEVKHESKIDKIESKTPWTAGLILGAVAEGGM